MTQSFYILQIRQFSLWYIIVLFIIYWIFNLQRLDRAWYDMDAGYDETQNPFADVSEEYTKKKEENMVKKAVKRMSAQQRQINKVNTNTEIFNFICWGGGGTCRLCL